MVPADAPGAIVEDVDPFVDSRWPPRSLPVGASLFSSRRWMRLLADTYGFDIRARILEQDGQTHGALAYARVDDLRGPRNVSLPFSDINDPIAASPDAWHELARGLFEDEPTTFRTRSHPVLCADPRLESTAVGVWHEIDATSPADELLPGFAQLPRRMIRRATRAGLTIDVSTSRTDLRSFFDLHVAVRKYRHGLLAQPFEFFDGLASLFLDSGCGVLVNARKDGVYAGGCVLLHEDDTLFYKFAASHPDHRDDGVNHAVLFAALAQAHDGGFRALDLGRSDYAGPGLIEFKRRFRPVEQVVTHHTYHPPGTGESDQMAETLDSITRVMVRPSVPDSVTAEAGGLLYRFFA